MGDRVLAGAPGDSTAILAAALAHPDRLLGAVPVTDPEAAAKAIAAGIGRRVTLAVGGRFTPAFVPLEITGDVMAVTDGRFIIKGPYQAGEAASLGPTAVVRIGSLRSEERRVGQECVSPCKSRGSPVPRKKQKQLQQN